jgi:hypothetical protein
METGWGSSFQIGAGRSASDPRFAKCEMKPHAVVVLAAIGMLGLPLIDSAQFTREEVASFDAWEAFLRKADFRDFRQMRGPNSITEPWIMELQSPDRKGRGLWKNVRGSPKGFPESWKAEVAAYRLSRLLGLNMVPPTVEARFLGMAGSLQGWVEGTSSLKDLIERNIVVPPEKETDWVRLFDLQQAFDNLIANYDRHQGNYLITSDWRMILIDHSRALQAGSKFDETLIFDKNAAGTAAIYMSRLPRTFVEKMRALNFQDIRSAVGRYLTDKEIEAVLTRRNLILKCLAGRIREWGEAAVLY